MKDTYRHKGLRQQLVSELRQKGIQDEAVLEAILMVPRHLFMDSTFVDWAYVDKAFPIGSDQTISQPFTVAFQTELLEVQPKDRILEVGTGSGYQAAILAAMGGRVYTIERFESLHKIASKILEKLFPNNVRTFLGDGYKGLPRYAPFDKIIVTAAGKAIPDALKEQLKPGGFLVMPVGSRHAQTMVRLTKNEDGSLEEEEFGRFRFVPLVKGVKKDKPQR